tara:strand:- start:241 stop:540 length:300 start_codon:yes stop_codon:yes gene_type:complete
MNWFSILKELSDRERLDAEEFAPEDMLEAQVHKIKPRLIELYEKYGDDPAPQSDFDSKIRASTEAEILLAKIGIKGLISSDFSRKKNIEGFKTLFGEYA